MNRRKASAILLAAIFLAFLALKPAFCAPPTAENEAAAKAINAFGVDLYDQIRKPDGNLIFSPYGISMCLAMAYAGARGNTESQIAKAMHLSIPQPKVGEAFAGANAQILAAGKGGTVEINVANALWAEKSYPFLKEYLEFTRVYTNQSDRFAQVPVLGGLLKSVAANDQGGIRQLDFRNNPDSARNTINTWVEEQTKNKIKDLFGPGTIGTDTRLVLTNAIYFKGKWANEFKKELTEQESFTLLDGKEIKVPMMHQTDVFGYVEEADLQVLEMSYKSDSGAPSKVGDLSMVVLLPSKETRLEDFEQSMTFQKLDHWIGSLKEGKVEVFLPRFKMTSGFQLRAALTKLGINDAFSGAADFSGMTGNKDLSIDEVIHKAFVETNEEGTEAAAATGMMMRGEARLPRPIPMFRADHPFVFLIRHKSTNCVLFMGRVTKP